jgi:4-aminobutyrate aminotransferase
MENAATVGQYAMDVLNEIKYRHPSIGDVRGKGLMIGVEFIKDQESKEPAAELVDRLGELAYERGLLLLSCGKSVVRIAPPLCITKAEIDEGMLIFDEALTLAEKETGITN